MGERLVGGSGPLLAGGAWQPGYSCGSRRLRAWSGGRVPSVGGLPEGGR